MKDSVLVTEVDTLQELIHEALDGGRLECAALAVGVHISFEVTIHILEDEHQLVLRVDDIMKCNDVLVFELLHKGYLADGGRRRAFFGVEVDFLQSNELAGLAIAAFEDLWTQHIVSSRKACRAVLKYPYCCICALSELFQLLERAGVALAVHGEADEG